MTYKKKMQQAGYLNRTSRLVKCPICHKTFQTFHKGNDIPCSEECSEAQLKQMGLLL